MVDLSIGLDAQLNDMDNTNNIQSDNRVEEKMVQLIKDGLEFYPCSGTYNSQIKSAAISFKNSILCQEP